MDSQGQLTVEGVLDGLVAAVRQQEDSYMRVMGCACRVMEGRGDIDSNIYIQDDIHRYKALLHQAHAHHQNTHHLLAQLIASTSQVAHLPLEGSLLKRVTYRLLEMVFTGVSQLGSRAPAPHYQEYVRLKLLCQKILGDGLQESVQLVAKAFVEHLNAKIPRALAFLTAIVELLESGDVAGLERLAVDDKDKDSQSKDREREEDRQDKPVWIDVSKRNRLRMKEKLAALREEQCVAEKNKLEQGKRAKKVMDRLKDVMEINRKDFISEYTFTNPHEQQKKLMSELTLRNTRNQLLIAQFQQKHHKQVTNYQLPHPDALLSHTDALKHTETLKHTDTLKQTEQPQPPSKCSTTRKSLLLSIKENDCGEATGSELLRRVKLEDNRFRLRSSNRSRDLPSSQKQSAVIKTIEEVLVDNDELALRLLPPAQQKLPILSKRAISVDQNYRSEEEAAVLSQSIRVGRREGREVAMAKVKVELKLGVLGGELSRKLTRIS